MTTQIKLTDTQRLVLEHAVDNNDGRLIWFPDNVKGGARQKVLTRNNLPSCRTGRRP